MSFAVAGTIAFSIESCLILGSERSLFEILTIRIRLHGKNMLFSVDFSLDQVGSKIRLEDALISLLEFNSVART